MSYSVDAVPSSCSSRITVMMYCILFGAWTQSRVDKSYGILYCSFRLNQKGFKRSEWCQRSFSCFFCFDQSQATFFFLFSSTLVISTSIVSLWSKPLFVGKKNLWPHIIVSVCSRVQRTQEKNRNDCKHSPTLENTP